MFFLLQEFGPEQERHLEEGESLRICSLCVSFGAVIPMCGFHVVMCGFHMCVMYSTLDSSLLYLEIISYPCLLYAH